MSSGNDYQKLLIVGTLLGIVGAVALIIGMFLGFDLIGVTTDIFGLAIVALVAGIFIVCLITFIGVITPQGFTTNDERPTLFALLLFIMTPTTLFSQYTTPMYYLLVQGNSMLGSGADFSFYIAFIGVALLFVAFMIVGWIYLWKNRLSATGGLNLSGGSSSNPIVKLLGIIVSILAVVAGVGIILGMVLPLSTSPFTDSSLLMSLDGSQLDLTALSFMVLVVFVVITAIFAILGNFGIMKTSNNIPLMIVMLIVAVLPGYAPFTAGLTAWSTPIYEVFGISQLIFDTGTQTTMCWFLVIGLLAFSLAFVLGILTYFFGTSSSYSKRVKVSSGGGLEARRKKGKFPTGPPSAAPPDLSSPSSGPPVGGTQPTVSSAPPQPPSFMPTSQVAAPSAGQKEPPTCPFCSKGLRFIDEYQRWYCDSCAQYV
ncbi:MAG: hypothetical protein FK730_13125 [Asgard group archaeon]|nr:hypothetical protein [Asgard group archaeon]